MRSRSWKAISCFNKEENNIWGSPKINFHYWISAFELCHFHSDKNPYYIPVSPSCLQRPPLLCNWLFDWMSHSPQPRKLSMSGQLLNVEYRGGIWMAQRNSFFVIGTYFCDLFRYMLWHWMFKPEAWRTSISIKTSGSTSGTHCKLNKTCAVYKCSKIINCKCNIRLACISAIRQQHVAC